MKQNLEIEDPMVGDAIRVWRSYDQLYPVDTLGVIESVTGRMQKMVRIRFNPSFPICSEGGELRFTDETYVDVEIEKLKKNLGQPIIKLLFKNNKFQPVEKLYQDLIEVKQFKLAL